MKGSGFNPLRWDCEKAGCFNKKRRPKVELFAECFPGKIAIGDVDGLVELKGCFLLLEWKGDGGYVRTGQRISYESFTEARGNIVFVVNGDAETMTVRSYSVFWGGKQSPETPACLEEVKGRMSAWVDWVLTKTKAWDAMWTKPFDSSPVL